MPTPMTPGLDIKLFSRPLMTAVANSTLLSEGPLSAIAELADAEHVPPTKLTALPKEELNRLRTRPIGLPIVEVLLPANRSATGWWQELFVTISEPESPPALKVLLLITTWLVKVKSVPPPPPQDFGYLTLTVVLTELTEPVVDPVVRPLFATERPTAGALTTLLIVPISSIAPVPFIIPVRNSAMAASTPELSGGATVKSAT